MGEQITFNYANWVALFPEFAGVSPGQAQLYFGLATDFMRNDGGGPVNNVQIQTDGLNLLTAHFAQMLAPSADGQAAPQLVGRISDATEGSVSVSTQNDYPPGSAQWYQQTKYGSTYYAMTVAFRTMRYKPGRRSRWWRGGSGPAWLYPFS